MAFFEFKTKIKNNDVPGVFDVTPQEVQQNSSQLLLVDVRRPDEYTGELGHIPGTQLIVLDTLPQHIENLPKDKTIVFVCRSGARSARATAFAHECGLPEVYNMKGGMILWNELKLETEGKASL